MDSPRSSEESLTHRRGDLHRRSLEETHPNDDEDYAGGEDDGIQLGLLSRKSRLGKERQVLGLDGDGLTTRQLVMGILAEVGRVICCATPSTYMSGSKTVPTLMSTVIGMVFTGELLERISVREVPGDNIHSLSDAIVTRRHGELYDSWTSCSS